MVEEWYDGIYMKDGSRSVPMMDLEAGRRNRRIAWFGPELSKRVTRQRRIVYHILDLANIRRTNGEKPFS